MAMGMAVPVNQLVGLLVHHFGPKQNISTTTGLIDKTFLADIHIPQMMNPIDLVSP